MIEHTPELHLDERQMGAEWLDWWSGLDDGITRSSRQPVLVAPRHPALPGSPLQASTQQGEHMRTTQDVLPA